MERLKIKYSQEVYKFISSSLRPMFKQAFTLRFEEEPAYDTIIEVLQRELNKVLISQNHVKPHIS